MDDCAPPRGAWETGPTWPVQGRKGMSTPLVLRRIMAALVLLCGLLAGTHASAAITNCRVTGTVNVTLSTCSLTKNIKFGTSSSISIGVVATGALPSPYYVALLSPKPVMQPNTFRLGGTFNSFRIYFSTYNKMASGPHTGTFDIRLCGDSACKKVLADVGLPYRFNVVVPPAISTLSPDSVIVGAGAFTLKVKGGGFTRDCKIYLNSTALATTFVSVSELATRLNLSSVKSAKGYHVTVIPATGIASNIVHFTLKNTVPVLTSINPASVPAAGGVNPPAITVTGSGFLPGSKVNLNGQAVFTQYVSSTEVIGTPAFEALNIITGGTYDITVTNPAPGGGASTPLTFIVANNVPSITSLSPNSELVSTSGSSLFITGTGLQPNSVVTVGGVSYPVTGSNTALTLLWVSLPAGLSAGNLPVVVTNPAPGGGTSGALTLTVNNPVPSIGWISPVSVHAGSVDMTLTLRVSNYNSSSQLEWNGTSLSGATVTTTALGTFLKVTVPAADLATAGTATVALVNPRPGGGTSQTNFAVTDSPEIDSLSPGFTATGGGDFTLAVYGQYFDSGATVEWNGNALATNFVSTTELHATVPASDIAGPGVASVTVVDANASSGPSLPASFAVDDSGTAVMPVAQKVNDLDWDATRSVFWASLTASDASHPDAIATIDPIGTAITGTHTATLVGEPKLLSVSGDGSMLYLNLGIVLQGYSLPTFTLKSAIGLGQITALRPSPVFSHVIAAEYLSGASRLPFLGLDGYLLVFGSSSEAWDAMAWNIDGIHLYAGDNTNTGNDFLTVVFNPLTNVSPTITSTPGVWTGTSMHLDAASGLIYADGSTAVIDPTVPSVTSAVYPLSGVMVPDSSLGCAYFITQTQAQVDAAAGDWTLSCYSTMDQTLTRSMVIPSVVGTPTKMLRWGNEGLAFMTDGGYIYFVSGQIVTGN